MHGQASNHHQTISLYIIVVHMIIYVMVSFVRVSAKGFVCKNFQKNFFWLIGLEMFRNIFKSDFPEKVF